MIALNLQEAQLFRLLADFFGRDQVIPHMSVMAVCGGALPERIIAVDAQISGWARRSKCLFTIVDPQDIPKMVVEFFSGFECAIDVHEEEHQRLLAPILKAVGLRYVTISPSEFSELLDPHSALDLFTLLKAKVEQDAAMGDSL